MRSYERPRRRRYQQLSQAALPSSQPEFLTDRITGAGQGGPPDADAAELPVICQVDHPREFQIDYRFDQTAIGLDSEIAAHLRASRR